MTVVAFVQIAFLVIYFSICFSMFPVSKGLSSLVKPIDLLPSDASCCFFILENPFLIRDKTHIGLAFFLVLRDPFLLFLPQWHVILFDLFGFVLVYSVQNNYFLSSYTVVNSILETLSYIMSYSIFHFAWPFILGHLFCYVALFVLATVCAA